MHALKSISFFHKERYDHKSTHACPESRTTFRPGTDKQPNTVRVLLMHSMADGWRAFSAGLDNAAASEKPVLATRCKLVLAFTWMR